MKATTFALPLLIVATLATPVLAKGHHDAVRQHQTIIVNSLLPHHNYRQVKARKLSPQHIAHILKRKGFRGLRNMRFDGRSYQVQARSKRGKTMRLIVNARNGNVIHRTVLRDMRPIKKHKWQRDNRRWQKHNNYKRQHRTPFWIN
ncbi:hypothetical protein SAMN04515647_1806 [Cohaesibacter sp. ES.047]|uniref:hypothetical protein n=1 Tax=Cohaesibacter sp. ES.047 TaxID=1798205 RepID=UPI000BB7BBBA|nr:hypothetical protein [Cohaesibacter sp. ES.047]SNY91578.1 hypothetical protein SAMN04515647_1806 [Cohaesibacter sp. ES.047]